MLEQTLTKGEQSLVSKGRADKVIEIRHEFQEAMREESMAKVAELTGRQVIAMLSANHVNPDLGAEIYVPRWTTGPPTARIRRGDRRRQRLVSDAHQDAAAAAPPQV